MYISGGENVYPAEVENVICAMPAVSAAAVVGVGDERWGQVGLAVIQAKPGASLTEDEVRAHCRECLGSFKVPRFLRFVDALPMNAQGKVLKQELKRRYGPAAAETEKGRREQG